ncbi:MAG: hypothetical protein WBW74_24240 [Xanthobacteraceae bacterium]
MRTAATTIALAAGLASVLALTGATSSSAQVRAGAEAETGYAASYCTPPNAHSSDEQRVYCEGWRAVRKGW